MSTYTKKPYVDRDTYISLDVETTGPIPGPYAMLSLGAVAYNADGVEVGTWYKKFTMMEGSSWHLGTWTWWKDWPIAYAEATSDQVYWKEAMASFIEWCGTFKKNGGSPILMASPATFDGMFVNYYGVQVAGDFSGLPWKHRILDIRTYIHGITKFEFNRAIGKSAFEVLDYTDSNPNPHFALDDARAQGEMYFAARKYREEKLYKKKETWLTKPVSEDSSDVSADSESVSTVG
jgi:hypothetical protein